MLFHVSIDVRNPERVAQVLGELLGGEALPFPPVAEGSWVAFAADDRNTAIEVYPRGTQLIEAPGDVSALGVPGEGGLSATHFAMATLMTADQVFTVAEREGWPAKLRQGDGFSAIELWIESDRMVEVLTAEMQAEYLAAFTPANWRTVLAESQERLAA